MTSPKARGAWTVAHSRLDPERLDVPSWSPEVEGWRVSLARTSYPKLKLRDIVDVIAGRNSRNQTHSGHNTALLIQAGAVREFRLDTTASPYIPLKEYEAVPRAQLRPGDVLVTSTGQYLGRAAVMESLPYPATVSGAVTILRPEQKVDPHYLVALLNSPLCRQQIERLQASSTGQPYIRRSDLGEIIIPIPPLDVQLVLAQKVSDLRQAAQDVAEKARTLEAQAQSLEAEARRIVSNVLEADRYE